MSEIIPSTRSDIEDVLTAIDIAQLTLSFENSQQYIILLELQDYINSDNFAVLGNDLDEVNGRLSILKTKVDWVTTQLEQVLDSFRFVRDDIANLYTQELNRYLALINVKLPELKTDIITTLNTYLIARTNDILNRIELRYNSTRQILQTQTDTLLAAINSIVGGNTGGSNGSTGEMVVVNVPDTITITGLIEALENLDDPIQITVSNELLTLLQGIQNNGGGGGVIDINSLGDILKNSLIDSYKSQAFKSALRPADEVLLEGINTVFNGAGAISGILNSLTDIGGETGNLLNGLISLVSPDTLIRMSIEAIAEPFIRHLFIKSSEIARSDQLTVEQWLGWYLFQPDNIDSTVKGLQELGYRDEDINRLIIQTRRQLSLDEIRQLYLRGDLDENSLNQYMHQLGYIGEDKQNVMKLWEILPPIQDIIRMAVRDVFSPNVVSEFGLMENIPDDYVNYAEKAGLNKEWSDRYWAAHWVLPSANQGFEMFQRQVISREQLEVLFQALDIAPKWREYLLQINYTPITRVDVRRMNDMGFLDFEETVKRYRDGGFSPQDAELMALWTEEYNSRGGDEGDVEVRKLTRTTIIKGFIRGLINEETAINQLVDLGYSQDNARFLLNLELSNRVLDDIPDNLKDNINRLNTLISKGYITGTLTENEARGQFDKLGYTQDEINSEIHYLNWEVETHINETIIELVKTRYVQYQINSSEVFNIMREFGFNENETARLIAIWDIIRINRYRLPTLANVKDFVANGVISVVEAQDYLRGLGYPDKTIQHYLLLWSM